MVKYIPLGDRKMFPSGTSTVLVMPSAFLKQNNLTANDRVDVLWDGRTDLLVRAKKGGK